MNFSRFENYARRLETDFNDMMADDRAARKVNRLEDRVISVPACDGYAYYKVGRVDGEIITLIHMNVYDGYRDTVIEQMDRTVTKTFVERHLAAKEQREAALAKYRTNR